MKPAVQILSIWNETLNTVSNVCRINRQFVNLLKLTKKRELKNIVV
jgi:hypothetical protein